MEGYQMGFEVVRGYWLRTWHNNKTGAIELAHAQTSPWYSPKKESQLFSGASAESDCVAWINSQEEIKEVD